MPVDYCDYEGDMMVIFVTVGTSSFDSLIKRIDELGLKERIIMQIGKGKYIPKNCEYFKFAPSLEKYYKISELIISHEGAGTLFEVCSLGKRVITITSPTTISNPDLVRKFAEEEYLIWCKDLSKIEDEIEKAKTFKFKRYRSPECKIAGQIKEFLAE